MGNSVLTTLEMNIGMESQVLELWSNTLMRKIEEITYPVYILVTYDTPLAFSTGFYLVFFRSSQALPFCASIIVVDMAHCLSIFREENANKYRYVRYIHTADGVLKVRRMGSTQYSTVLRTVESVIKGTKYEVLRMYIRYIWGKFIYCRILLHIIIIIII